MFQDFHIGGGRKGFRKGHADDVAVLGQPQPGRPVEIADAPVSIDDEHAVGGALKDHRDAGGGFLGFLLGLGQFVLTVFQRIGHGVERIGNPCDFGCSADVYTSVEFTEPPLIGGVDKLPKRTMDKPPGAQ